MVCTRRRLQLDLGRVERHFRGRQLTRQRVRKIRQLPLLEIGGDIHELAKPGVENAGGELAIRILKGQP